MEITTNKANDNNIVAPAAKYSTGDLSSISERYHAETLSEHNSNAKVIRILLCIGVGFIIIGIALAWFNHFFAGALASVSGLILDGILGAMLTFYTKNEQAKYSYFSSMVKQQEQMRKNDRLDKMLDLLHIFDNDELKMRIIMAIITSDSHDN